MGLLINGQVGWRAATVIAPSTPTLWTSVYAVYNADATGSSSLKTSLVAAYNGESNANDSFGSNNGTAVGGLTYTTGKIGNAFDFNGTNAYVSIPNTSGQLDFTGDFSISTWVMPYVTSASYNMYFSNYKAGGTYGSGFLFFLDRTVNKLTFNLRNQTNASYYEFSWIPLVNTWYHLTVTRKASTGTKLYINGVEVVGSYNPSYSGATLNPTYQTGQIYNIGGHNNGTALGNYRQDAVNVWNKELTQAEITELYNSGNGAQYITDNFYKPTPNDALNTYNGTAQGGLTYGVGKVGTAFQFNGTNAYVSLPNNSFNFTGDFSVSGWINQSSTPLYHMIMGNQAAVSGNYYGWLVWVFNNKLTLDLYNGNGSAASARWQPTSTLSTNTWIHFAITKKPGQAVKMYLNGVSVPISIIFGSNSGTVTYTTTNYSAIGVNKYSSPIVVADAGYWNGSMDALNVWNKELTQSEITELYNSGNGKQYTI